MFLIGLPCTGSMAHFLFLLQLKLFLILVDSMIKRFELTTAPLFGDPMLSFWDFTSCEHNLRKFMYTNQ